MRENIRIFANTIPALQSQAIENAVRAGIEDLPGSWEVELLADQRNDVYQVRIKRDSGPYWQWDFSGPWEHKPEVIQKRIWNGLRGNIPRTLKESREDVLRIASQHGASELKLFGSRAQGQAAPDSDLDLLVKLGPGRSLLDLISLQHDLEDLLGCKVDVLTEEAISPYIREEVLKEAVPL